jgi:CobQ-like glutamine amidotransferase family enzyme
MQIKVCHLYPDLLNLYGDRGNVLIFCRRAEWRGIEVQLDLISLQDRVRFTDYDFIFVGGGADVEQGLVSRDLDNKGPLLIDAVEQGVALLSICGGYQLLGRFYRAQDGTTLPGVGLFDLYTEAGNNRLRGNILLNLSPDLCTGAGTSTGQQLTTLVGFENHSGRTFLGDSVQPLARVVKGNGNNGRDGTEGVCYKNAFGTYSHGPFLSKNPHFADLLITRALSRRYGSVDMVPLDDTMEINAHRVIEERLK